MTSKRSGKSKVYAGDQEFLPSYLSQSQFPIPGKQDYNTYVREQTFNPYRGYETTTKILTIDKTTDNVYLNVTISHPNYIGVTGATAGVGATGINFPQMYVTGESPVEATYNVTKTDPILDRCSDYYCSIVRFDIPLDQIPLAICPIIPNQSNPDLTPLIIGIEYGVTGGLGSRYPVNVNYFNQNPLTPPIQNQPTQIVTPYYYIYSYQNFINMFNAALSTSWVESGLATLFPHYFAPYFYFDPTTNLISLIVPKCFVTLTSPATHIPTIFMNSALNTYLDAFNVTYRFYDSPQGNDVYFILSANNTPDHFFYPGGVLVPTATDPATTDPAVPYYYKFTQEYSVLEYWLSLRKILVTSSNIPIRSEYLPSGGIANVNDNGINATFPVISDFVPNIGESAGSSRSIAHYLPSAQYRLVDMVSDNSLQNVDIRLYWQDDDGNIYPLELSVFQQANLKILFTRKSLYKNDQQLIG